MRFKSSVLLLSLLLAMPSLAAPPSLEIPAEIKPSADYAVFAPDAKTTVKTITYIGLSGVDPFPSDLLRDPRAFVLPVRGLAAGRYRFVAVGSLNDEHAKKEFAVIVGAPSDPLPDPKPQPPVDPLPPAGIAKHLSFVVAGAEGANVVNDATLRNWLKVGGVAVHVLAAGGALPGGFQERIDAVGLPCFIIQDARGKVLTAAKVTTAEAVEDAVEPLFEKPLLKKEE